MGIFDWFGKKDEKAANGSGVLSTLEERMSLAQREEQRIRRELADARDSHADLFLIEAQKVAEDIRRGVAGGA